MRKLLTVSFCMLLCLICAGIPKDAVIPKTEVGLDLGAAIGKHAFTFFIGRQISRQWSLEGSHTLIAGMLTKKADEEELAHYQEFKTEDEQSATNVEDLFSGNIRLKYWLTDIHKGGYFMAGCRIGQRKGMDGTIGAGYSIHIWKGWRCAVSYEIDIRESCIHQRPRGNGLGFTLSYTY
jgi:hypothetical protein